MALSLNEGSRGLLMDPFNGAADIEAKLIRTLHNYAFVEDPSRLIRATRFTARFHWPLEERTQMRYESAKENNYIEYIADKAIGYELGQIAHEDDPLHVLKSLEKEGWLKVLAPHWTSAKVDTAGLGQLMKTRQQMNELGYLPDPSPAVMYFLTSRLSNKEINDIRKLIPRKDLVEAWRDLEEHAKETAKRLTGKEAATPSRTWKLLTEIRPEMTLFLAVTSRQQAVQQKIKNFFTKWRQVQQKIPLPEMTELLITPQLPEYPKIAHDVFMLLLDGKLRSRTETLKFLKPLAPPPPPPPPPPKRGRAAKAAAASATAATAEAGKKKAKGAAAPWAHAPATAKVPEKVGNTGQKPPAKSAQVAAPPANKAAPAKPAKSSAPTKPEATKHHPAKAPTKPAVKKHKTKKH
jgi:tRNA nucleotidyltransferase/poly(A) polymerase